MASPLEGAAALVTGASRGIGRATAIRLAESGVKVALVARDEAALDQVAEECKAAGGPACVIAGDLTDDRFCTEAVQRARAAFGDINLLVNNAGLGLGGSSLDVPWTQWDRMIDVNLRAVMRLTHAALPSMKRAAWASIVFVASVSGKVPFGGAAGYSATKHGVVGFAGAVFEDVRHLGIKVSTICPGWVATSMSEDLGVPGHEVIQPDDVARTIVFAASMPASACATEIILRSQRPPHL